MDISNITDIITTFRAETQKNSVTPETVGAIMQGLAELLANAENATQIAENLKAAVLAEKQQRVAADTRIDNKIKETETNIIKLMSGKGADANAHLYPCLDLGNVFSQDEVNAVLDEIYTAREIKYNGRMRLTRNGALIIVSQHVVNATQWRWAQCVMGMVRPAADGSSLLAANEFDIVARSTDYNGNAKPWHSVGGEQQFKTINGVPITGKGNIQVSPEGSIAIDGIVDPSSENAVSGKGVATAIKETKDELTANVLKLGVPFAQQVTTRDTTYILKNNFNLEGAAVNIPEGVVLKFEGGEIANGSLVLQNTYLDGDVKLAADVAVSGTCANMTAKQSWFAGDDVDAWHRLINNVSGCKAYDYTTGVYSPMVAVSKTADVMRINGNGAVLNIPVAMTQPFSISPANFVQSTEVLTANVQKGDTKIQIANAADYQQGDFFMLLDYSPSSFSPDRAAYMEGEILCVRNTYTSGGVSYIVPTTQIWGNYKHASSGNVKIVKISLASVSIRNLTLRSINDFNKTGTEIVAIRGLSFTGCMVNLDNVVAENFSICCIMFNCINSSIRNCRFIGYNCGTGIDGYGVMLGNSQSVIIDGGEYAGKNHGIATGGTAEYPVVCRFITIRNTVTQSWKFEGSLNTHGNAQYVLIEGNYAKGIPAHGDFITIRDNVCTGYIDCAGYPSFNCTVENNICSYINISANSAVDSYGGTFDNWTPQTSVEKCIIRGNKAGYLSMGLNTEPTTYPNSANIDVLVEGCQFDNVRGILYPYRGESNLNANIDLGAKVRFVNTTIKTETASNQHFRAETITFDNCIVERVAAGVAFTANNIEVRDSRWSSNNNLNYRKAMRATDNLVIGSFVRAKINVGAAVEGVTALTENYYYKDGRWTDEDGFTAAAHIGTTAERPSLQLTDNGFGYYDKTIDKMLRFVIKGKAAVTASVVSNNTTPYDGANPINSARMIYVTFSRSGTKTVYFCPTSTFDEATALVGISTAQLNGFFTSPDPAQYPYIHVTSTAASNCTTEFHEVREWVEDDGASAGVARNGATADRPTGGDVYVGFRFFDTTLGKPVFVKTINGETVTWVDAAGATI